MVAPLNTSGDSSQRSEIKSMPRLWHLDLFSGIGGFAYAIDQVWSGVEHTFCDNEPFAREILHKHWPEAYIYDDIRAITDTGRQHGQSGGTEGSHGEKAKRSASAEEVERPDRPFILTGGFPCQPFSAAGLRRGTADDRHLWPEMLRVIRLTEPQWVIAENVGGIITWNDGLVFEQVCADLEAAGYEVQPFVIPAVAVNAPHRRDRVWFVANRSSQQNDGKRRTDKRGRNALGRETQTAQQDHRKARHDGLGGQDSPSWGRDWLEVAAELCGMDDGVPGRLGEATVSKSQHRGGQLKAYGNAIVPEVAMEIIRAISLI